MPRDLVETFGITEEDLDQRDLVKRFALNLPVGDYPSFDPRQGPPTPGTYTREPTSYGSPLGVQMPTGGLDRSYLNLPVAEYPSVDPRQGPPRTEAYAQEPSPYAAMVGEPMPIGGPERLPAGPQIPRAYSAPLPIGGPRRIPAGPVQQEADEKAPEPQVASLREKLKALVREIDNLPKDEQERAAAVTDLVSRVEEFRQIDPDLGEELRDRIMARQGEPIRVPETWQATSGRIAQAGLEFSLRPLAAFESLQREQMNRGGQKATGPPGWYTQLRQGIDKPFTEAYEPATGFQGAIRDIGGIIAQAPAMALMGPTAFAGSDALTWYAEHPEKAHRARNAFLRFFAMRAMVSARLRSIFGSKAAAEDFATGIMRRAGTGLAVGGGMSALDAAMEGQNLDAIAKRTIKGAWEMAAADAIIGSGTTGLARLRGEGGPSRAPLGERPTRFIETPEGRREVEKVTGTVPPPHMTYWDFKTLGYEPEPIPVQPKAPQAEPRPSTRTATTIWINGEPVGATVVLREGRPDRIVLTPKTGKIEVIKVPAESQGMSADEILAQMERMHPKPEAGAPPAPEQPAAPPPTGQAPSAGAGPTTEAEPSALPEARRYTDIKPQWDGQALELTGLGEKLSVGTSLPGTGGRAVKIIPKSWRQQFEPFRGSPEILDAIKNLTPEVMPVSAKQGSYWLVPKEALKEVRTKFGIEGNWINQAQQAPPEILPAGSATPAAPAEPFTAEQPQGKSYAPTIRQQQVGGEQQYPGTPPGSNLPTYQGEIRQGQGGQAGGGYRAEPGATEPAERLPPSLPPEKTVTPAVEEAPFGHSDIKKEILNWYENESGERPITEEMVRNLGERGNEFTFYGELPDEVKRYLEGAPAGAKSLFQITDEPRLAGGVDAMHSMGEDNYFRVADRFLQSKKGSVLRFGKAKDAAAKSNDPRAQMLAWIYDNVTPIKGPKQIIDPSRQATYSKFRIGGHEFEIVEDENGYRVLRDGKNFPVLPADMIGPLKIERGSAQVMTEPEAAAPPPVEQEEARPIGAQKVVSPGEVAQAPAQLRPESVEPSPSSPSAGQRPPLRSGFTLNPAELITDAAKKVGEGFANVHREWRRAGGEMFPKLSDLGARESVESAVKMVSDRAAVEFTVQKDWDYVLGRDPKRKWWQWWKPTYDVDRARLLGAWLMEDKLQAVRDRYLANNQPEEAAKVKSLVGKPGSPLTRSGPHSFEELWKDPSFQRQVKRYKEWHESDPNERFILANGVTPEDAGRMIHGKYSGTVVNAIPLDKNGQPVFDKYSGGGEGNIKNAFLKKLFNRVFTGQAGDYELDLGKMMARTREVGWRISEQHRLYDNLVEEGVAVQAPPGTFPTIGGQPSRAIPKDRLIGKYKGVNDLFIRDDAYPEIRRALNVDAFTRRHWGVGLIEDLQLASLRDLQYHLKNQLTILVASPGLGLTVDKWVNHAVNALKNDPETARTFAGLAQIGAMRPSIHGEIGSRFLAFTDKVTRLVLNDAFDEMVRQKRFIDTPKNRRDFINRIGQYNPKAQNQFIVTLRNMGAPFLTAGLNYNIQGIRTLTAYPGAKAPNLVAEMANRGEVAVRLIAAGALVSFINNLRWGNPFGSAATPLGSIRLDDDEETGRERHWDILNWTGLPRGARGTGTAALAEGLRSGKSPQQIRGEMERQIAETWISPFAGPIPTAAMVALSGYSPHGFRKVAKDVGPESKATQMEQNLKTALKESNAFLQMLAPEESDVQNQSMARSLLGPFAPQLGRSQTQAEEAARIQEFAQARKFIEGLVVSARRVPKYKRMDYIRDQVNDNLPEHMRERAYLEMERRHVMDAP